MINRILEINTINHSHNAICWNLHSSRLGKTNNNYSWKSQEIPEIFRKMSTRTGQRYHFFSAKTASAQTGPRKTVLQYERIHNSPSVNQNA